MISAELARLDSAYAPTPLVDLPQLASHLGVGRILVKDESHRALGNFKSLGGAYAGLRALARVVGIGIAELVATRPAGQPCLICASDGNHGLAVAYAARFAGAPARVFLHADVPAARARRIADTGASIEWVAGTYDDAVDAAASASRDGEGILIADTSDDPHDAVVRDVMAGYGVIASEVRQQSDVAGWEAPTHVFVQAGVGGIAAAMAQGLSGWMEGPIIAVEPENAACLSAALAEGQPLRISGDLRTAAEMLSCGEASAPAIAVLLRHRAKVMTVSESGLTEAPSVLASQGGPRTTPSGAAGLAGLVALRADALQARRLGLGPESRVLVLVTEGVVEDTE